MAPTIVSPTRLQRTSRPVAEAGGRRRPQRLRPHTVGRVTAAAVGRLPSTSSLRSFSVGTSFVPHTSSCPLQEARTRQDGVAQILQPARMIPSRASPGAATTAAHAPLHVFLGRSRSGSSCTRSQHLLHLLLRPASAGHAGDDVGLVQPLTKVSWLLARLDLSHPCRKENIFRDSASSANSVFDFLLLHSSDHPGADSR